MQIEQFIKHSYNTCKSPETAKRYIREAKLFCELYHPSTVAYSDVQEYFNELVSTQAKGTVNTVKAALVYYFDFLINSNQLSDNPIKNIVIPKQDRRINHSALLSSEELDILIEDRLERYEVLKWRNKFLLSLIRYQGLTNADLLQLKVTDIKNDEEIIISAKSGLNQRNYKLNGKQVKFWLKYEVIRNENIKEDTDQLFLNKRGLPITQDGVTSVVDTLKPLFPYKKINLKIIRQSVIAEKMNSCKDVIETKKFSGHKWGSTTSKYSNPISEEMKLEVEKYHPFLSM